MTPHRIVTGDAQPFCRRAYRISPLEKAFVEEQLDMNLSAGIVRPSTSPWAAPVVLVKKNNKLRFCVDYRGLNKLTVRDSYPLPRIDDTLDRLSGALYFTTLDAASDIGKCLFTLQINIRLLLLRTVVFSNGQLCHSASLTLQLRFKE